ncbi:hypothetical protein BKA82DRAFT_67705, partial [Pisolithus tinctorius]
VDALRRFPLVLVSKSRVKCIIKWLTSNNEWYMKNGISFSLENLAVLVNSSEDSGVLQGIEITHLWDEDEASDSGVTYTDGDRSEQSCCTMKVSHTGSELMNENSPGFLSAVFPHLDPWGIA